MNIYSIATMRAEAEAITCGISTGEPLDALSVALIELAVAVSVTTLEPTSIAVAVDLAFDTGASVAQVQEIIALVSGLGVHSLMASARVVLGAADRRGLIDAASPLDPERALLWAQYVGDDPFWLAFSEELPGFLDALLRLSPDIFLGFFAYCAIPWRSGTVRAKTKELAAMACDATPTHCFYPGFRVHLKNAMQLGIGRIAILQALDIAARVPLHPDTD